MSFVGWLDHSEDEQRQVREVLRALETPETVDDLGIGSIRDLISNALFPGTSIIQTRARYFLFIPWIFKRAEERPERLLARAEQMERQLVSVLLKGSDQDGLIGRVAGPQVRTLPSAIYWSGLATYGIFRGRLTLRSYARAVNSRRVVVDREDEVALRDVMFWDPEIPPPPPGFFPLERASGDVPDGEPSWFSLRREEADWLVERVLSTELLQGRNLLCDLVRKLRAGDGPPDGPLEEVLYSADMDTATRELVANACIFSTVMRGASLLYNLELARERNDEEAGDPHRADDLRVELDEWASDAGQPDVQRWAKVLDSFWDSVGIHGNQSGVQIFVSEWAEIVTENDLQGISDLPRAKKLIREREIAHKRGQSRFENPDRLRAWNGASGMRPLDYRWPQVQRFLRDLHAGLEIGASQVRSGPQGPGGHRAGS